MGPPIRNTQRGPIFWPALTLVTFERACLLLEVVRCVGWS